MTPVEKINELMTRGDSRQIIDYVIVNPEIFNVLIDMYIAGLPRVSQRLASVVTEIGSINHALMMPYWPRLIKALKNKNVPIVLKRNTIRMMQFVAIPRRYQGVVLDLCMGYLSQRSESIAVRVFAMSVAELMTRGSAELREELKIIIEDQLPYASAAFRSRARRVLKVLRPL